MRLSATALLALIVALGATMYGTSQQAGADIATPRNFVLNINCTSLTEATVTFSIPGTTDLNNKFVQAPREIWIDLSLSNNNFAAGTFLTSGAIIPREGVPNHVYRWSGVVRDSTHYYRLNGLFPDGGWGEVGRGTFRTPDCAPVTEMYCEAGGTMGARFSAGTGSVFGPERPAIEQWIDLSIFGNPRNPELDNGFPPGTFIGAGPFPPHGFDFEWRGLLPATRHYSRVNVLHGGPPLIGSSDQWEAALGSRFTTLDCRDLPQTLPPNP